MFWAAQAERWEGGMERGGDCRERGASMKVATRPEAMCHSMWQWKSQTRKEGVLAWVLLLGGGFGLRGGEKGGTYQDYRHGNVIRCFRSVSR